MKPYAAAPGVEDGRHQQVIQVHSHGGQQDEPGFFPVLRVIPVGDKAYYEEVEGVMKESLCQGCVLKFRIRGSKVRPKLGFFLFAGIL